MCDCCCGFNETPETESEKQVDKIKQERKRAKAVLRGDRHDVFSDCKAFLIQKVRI
jgi:hypothetical protein